MPARARAHVLTITTSFDFCVGDGGCAAYFRYPVPCQGHRDMQWEITCPYRDDYDMDKRGCTVYSGCDCRLTEEQIEELEEVEEQFCPDSPTGLHLNINNGDIFPAIPMRGCWVNHCPCADDHVEGFQMDHGDGTWFVLVYASDSIDCDEGVSFSPLARLES